MSVEKTLEPLVLQVTTLVNTKGPSKKKKGKSKRANALVSTVEKATENFIEKGEQIAYENPDITQEMLAAVEEVKKTGKLLHTTRTVKSMSKKCQRYQATSNFILNYRRSN